jgi:hypothetical protein
MHKFLCGHRFSVLSALRFLAFSLPSLHGTLPVDCGGAGGVNDDECSEGTGCNVTLPWCCGHSPLPPARPRPFMAALTALGCHRSQCEVGKLRPRISRCVLQSQDWFPPCCALGLVSDLRSQSSAANCSSASVRLRPRPQPLG